LGKKRLGEGRCPLVAAASAALKGALFADRGGDRRVAAVPPWAFAHGRKVKQARAEVLMPGN
jgi:hypothetical protein